MITDRQYKEMAADGQNTVIENLYFPDGCISDLDLWRRDILKKHADVYEFYDPAVGECFLCHNFKTAFLYCRHVSKTMRIRAGGHVIRGEPILFPCPICDWDHFKAQYKAVRKAFDDKWDAVDAKYGTKKHRNTDDDEKGEIEENDNLPF